MNTLFPETGKIILGEKFITEKKPDEYREVKFVYDNEVWEGCIPVKLEKQGMEFSDEELNELLEDFYKALDPDRKSEWIAASDRKWKAGKERDQTYKVLKALYSGKWECRVCGPVPSVNPQPSARLTALRHKGYIIGCKRKHCPTCDKKQMHDILIMLPELQKRFTHGNDLRKPMSDKLKERIKKVLGKRDVCFNVERSSKELIVDHKFPSQRWLQPESDNPDDMPEQAIKEKFQILSNQTNMWKSRYCDRCVATGLRGEFMGVKWYYEGNEQWSGQKSDPKGCIGCPWFDLDLWKKKLMQSLKV